MKQSTKLLSLVLALVMAFSFVGVIGNAGLVKGDIKYDSVDDANLTAEQVADLALDMVDSDVMYSINKGKTLDLSILGEVRTDTIDHMLADIYSLYSSGWWTIGKGLLGDAGDLNLKMLKNVQRSGGDLNVIYALLELLDTNRSIISKAAYGIGSGSNQLDIGLIESFMDLGETGDILGDIPRYLVQYAYEELVQGSYNNEAGYANNSYPKLDDLKSSKFDTFATLPTDVDSLDEIVNRVIGALLTLPQDYSWEGEGENVTKVWDENSVVFPSIANTYDVATVASAVSPSTHTFFQILDTIAPFAINDLGVTTLNNNLKKQLMEGVEVEFNEIDAAKLPADAKAAFDAEDEYVTYISYDRLYKSGSTWYYTTLKRTEVIDPATGEAKLDDNGNKVTEQVRKYYKANVGGANEFYDLINWDYEFTADPEPLVAGDGSDLACLDYEYLIETYGSIFGSLNHLLYMVYEVGLNQTVKDMFVETTDDGWVDGTNEDALMNNLERLLKFLLAEFGDKIFGRDSAYANINYSDIEDQSIIGLIATMGPVFFEDAMPQLVMPKDETGAYAFGDDSQLLKFAALVVREFVSEISPTTNYDEYIFAEGTVTSADDRQFAEYSSDEWFDIIINMAMDIAYTYLNNLTNFNTPTPEKGIDEARWMGMLDEAIIWATKYVGSGSSSLIAGMDPDTVAAIDGPINKLSYILNKILPLGFISGCTSSEYDFDLQMVYDRVKNLLTTFDLNSILGLFGRNTESQFNLLSSTNLIEGVIKLVNQVLTLVFAQEVIPTASSLDSLVSQANLKVIVDKLLNALYTNRVNLIENALPVLAKFIPEWGGEQEFEKPEISLKKTVDLTNGALSGASFNIANGSVGVWRHYKDADGAEYQDEQYKFSVTSIQALNYDGSASSYVSNLAYSTGLVDYGESIAVTYDVANVAAHGAIAKFVVKYLIYDEDGNAMADGAEFELSTFVWLSYNATDDGTQYITNRKNNGDYIARIYSPRYVGLSSAATKVPSLVTSGIQRDSVSFSGSQTLATEWQGTQTVDGIKWGNATFSLNSKKWRINSIRNFGNYTESVQDSDGDGNTFTYTIDGGFDEAAWNAANKTQGSTSEWTIRVYARGDHNNYPFKIIYYDDVYASKLSDLVDSENKAMRTTTEYNTSGTFYADRELVATDDPSTEGNEKETNFSTTAVDPDTNEVVTVIDAAQAWATYYAALQAAIRTGWQEFNTDTEYAHKDRYDALRIAANDLQYIKKTSQQIAEEGGATLDTYVDELKVLRDSIVAEYSTDKDYTDYMMYRFNRYNDAVKQASKIIDAKKAAAPLSADKNYFTYTNITETDLNALVKGDANETIILALLEAYDEAEYAAQEAKLEAAKNRYAGYEAIEVSQAENMLNKMSERLLTRGGVDTTYLSDEIDSAEAMITDSSLYTARSWAIYEKALADAKEVLGNPTQMTAFDAKYALLVARNGLVLVEDEADYSELEALIAQAQQALANKNLYDNTDKEFGQVLAELGYNALTDADGNSVQLFPGSALLVNEKAYGADDQKKVDRAATALKEALARLKFKNVAISGADVTTETIVPGDADKGTEEVKASVARINACMDADAVKALFSVAASGAGAVETTVSNDVNYTVGTDLTGFAGTNSTVTFYTSVSGVKVPVATVKIVVDADVNGDGVVDVLDAAVTELVTTSHATLEGCYFLAGNLDKATDTIVAADYSAVVNKVLAA